VSEQTTADQKILEILATLQQALGDGSGRLEPSEVARVREILRHGKTLVDLAKYEEAKGLFWAHQRGLILGAGAVLSAAVLFWSNAEKLGLKILGLFQ
jgi:hypothetical protein